MSTTAGHPQSIHNEEHSTEPSGMRSGGDSVGWRIDCLIPVILACYLNCQVTGLDHISLTLMKLFKEKNTQSQ